LLSVGLNASPLVAPHTGVGRYILGLLRGLACLRGTGDFEVRALFAPAALTSSSEARRSASAGGGLFRLARDVAKRLPFAYPLAQAVRAAALEAARLRGQVGVYHETNHAAPFSRAPVVLTVHDLSTLLMPETQERRRAAHFGRALREHAREAARVITPTQAIADQVVELLGVARERVRAIHHGVDPALLEGPTAAAGRAGGETAAPPPALSALGVRGPYLLFVGALEPRKGLPSLLDAYDALPAALARELPLVLAGPEERLDEALRFRLAAGREGRLVRTGYVAPGDLPALYRGARALCLPSLYEGFGLPLLEALALGIPCLASDDPALVEVAGGAALHAPRGDAHAMAHAIERLVSDPSLRSELSGKGRARATGFTWEASARAHLEVYREAAAP
jgi:alpha-1,3-rhamnosyl/mannosyltransferase